MAPPSSRNPGPDDRSIHVEPYCPVIEPDLLSGANNSGCHNRVSVVGVKIIYYFLRHVGSFHASVSVIAYGDLHLQAPLTATKEITKHSYS